MIPARPESVGRLTGSKPQSPTGRIALGPKKQMDAVATGDKHGPREDNQRVSATSQICLTPP